MADKETTPPPKAISTTASNSPLTPVAKRARMTSPNSTGQDEHEQASRAEAAENEAPTTQLLTDDGQVEADDGYSDSGFGTDNSDTTSIASSIYAGYIENGRRYQVTREGEYWGPSDEKQFESMETCHIVHSILDSREKNPLFFSPISKNAQHILDIGAGTGAWCRDVADHFPSTVVTGVDLYPPPDTWVPPNCRLEVDDVLKTWTWHQSFDLIHMRYLLGAFTDKQWANLYSQAYKNLVPGGWIEQIEPNINFYCDDGTQPADAFVGSWGSTIGTAFAKTGKDVHTESSFKDRITAAGFINLHEKIYKVPCGDWAKNPLLKEAGKFEKMQVLSGLEGYAMFTLTKFGDPQPWSPEEVLVYVAKVRKEMVSGGFHSYFRMRRIWAQKPFDTEPAAEKPEVVV